MNEERRTVDMIYAFECVGVHVREVAQFKALLEGYSYVAKPLNSSDFQQKEH